MDSFSTLMAVLRVVKISEKKASIAVLRL